MARVGTVDTLVIGYGNNLRSDDGAGRVVADRIEALGLPGVEVHSMSQLVPELSLQIAGTDRVVFVDASAEADETTIALIEAAPAEGSAWTHYTTPASLLAMTGTVGAVPALAYAVVVPVEDMGLGTELSARASAEVEIAVDLIARLIGE